MDLLGKADKLKLVELYSFLLVLCTALLVFGMLQMQLMLSSMLSETAISPFKMVLQGVQVSAVGLVLTTFIMVLFFKALRKKQAAADKKKRALALEESGFF